MWAPSQRPGSPCVKENCISNKGQLRHCGEGRNPACGNASSLVTVAVHKTGLLIVAISGYLHDLGKFSCDVYCAMGYVLSICIGHNGRS